jgi:hypothetical protein
MSETAFAGSGFFLFLPGLPGSICFLPEKEGKEEKRGFLLFVFPLSPFVPLL